MNTLGIKTLTVLTLAPFLAIVFFSFATMAYGPDGQMIGDCMFGVIGQADCPGDIVAAAIHHISAYLSFLALLVSPGLTTLLVALVFAVCLIYLFFIRAPILAPPPPARRLGTSPPNAFNRILTRWLALFEHSPSFS